MKIPSISEAEWDVMTVIWASHPITATEVVDSLAGKKNWNPRTVKTLLNRLVKKGALAYTVDGKKYLYRPKVQQHQCVLHESRSFLSRVFAGDAAAMLLRFVDEVDLSPEEINQLKKAIDKKRG
ncbi:MAG TPA: BlaI/MecI/CopY family transcriptional regulator [Tepidisphaeraceae bacterium]|jgi:BlaI family penicillinase repressor